jgi:hypothetical protein
MSNCKSILISGVLALSLTSLSAEAHLFGSSDFNSGNTLNLNGTSLANTNSGWYWGSIAELSNYATQNYAVAAASEGDVGGIAFDNYFVFNISGLTQPITTASITLDSYDVAAPQSYSLYEFKGSVSDLLSGANSATTFSQLGVGPVVGSFAYVPSDSNLFKTITLSSTFVADINAASKHATIHGS